MVDSGVSESFRAPIEPRAAASERVAVPGGAGSELLAAEGYADLRLIAASGRGDIYRAKDRAGHEVAIRLMTPEHFADAEAIEAFAREARASLRLHHPHLVRSIAAAQRDEHRYLIMELVDGGSLRNRVLEGGPLSEREAIVLLQQVAQALGYAWRHGVAHRDVTPTNILLAPARVGHREPFCAKLANFGLSRLRDLHAERPAKTSTGRIVRAKPGQDHRADIRGLAAAVCWALTPQARDEDSPGSTLGVDGVSPQTMQLLGSMLDTASRLTSWEGVIESARHLPIPPAGTSRTRAR
jgi:serine/threonine protein kinase